MSAQDDMMEVKVAVLAGSNGKVAAVVFEGRNTDWGLLADCIMDWQEGSEPKDPDAVTKCVVTAMVPRPKFQEINGTVEEIRQ